jgi:hypothetical protein
MNRSQRNRRRKSWDRFKQASSARRNVRLIIKQSFDPIYHRTCLQCFGDTEMSFDRYCILEPFLCSACRRNDPDLSRKARIEQATPPWADKEAIRLIYEMSKTITAQTGIQHHVDHIIPLKSDLVCGLHIAENLRIIPAVHNLRKGNKFTTLFFSTGDTHISSTSNWPSTHSEECR